MAAPAADNRPLYSSRIPNTYVQFIRKNYGHIDVDELLRYAGIEPYQLADEGHWFSQEQVNRFHARLNELAGGNNNIAREAGRYSASPEFLGGIKTYILSLGSPAIALKLFGQGAEKFTRSSIYESKKITRNKVEILVTPREGTRESPFQCLNRMGYLEAIPLLFNYKLPRIEHPECVFRGDKACRYLVSWQDSRSALWKKTRNYAALSLPVVLIVLFLILPSAAILSTVAAVFAVVILMMSCYAGQLDARELRAALDSLKGSSDELIKQINVNYENALMINEIGQELSRELDTDGVLANVTEVLKKRLKYDRGLIMLADPGKTRLFYRAGYGFTDEQRGILEDASFNLDSPEPRGLFVLVFREQRPLLLDDIDREKAKMSARAYDLARKMGTRSFVCCPIVYKNESLGVFAVDNINTRKPLLQSDINLLMGVAAQIGFIAEQKQSEEKIRQSRFKLRLLTARLSEAEEAERRMLASELHDRVGQNLTALNLNLSIVQGLLTAAKNENVNARISDSIFLTEEITKSTRDVMTELRPEGLDDYGLLTALRLYGGRLSERTGLAVEISGDEILPRPAQVVESALFRIAQEALTNVAKHARAGRVIVSLEQRDRLFRLSISDNGQGCNMKNMARDNKRAAGWGLLIMQERAAALGGQVWIESGPGGGTCVVAEIEEGERQRTAEK